MVGREGLAQDYVSSNLVICATRLGWEERASGPAPQQRHLTLLRAAVLQLLVLGQTAGTELCLFWTLRQASPGVHVHNDPPTDSGLLLFGYMVGLS